MRKAKEQQKQSLTRFGRYVCVIAILTIQQSGFLLANETVAFKPGKKWNCKRWDVIDIRFTTKEKVSQPFAVEFGAVFMGPDNATLKVPGFYDGDNSFMIRFSPPETGEWTFRTYSDLPDLAGLTATVTGKRQDDVTRHGPLQIKPENPQRFYYADGTPYFLLAFEVDWLFALDYQNKADIPKTKMLVDAMAENGLNHAVMNVYAYDVVWGKDPDLKSEHEFGAPAIFPFEGTNDNPDFSALNVDFFKHYDRVIRYLDEKGIIAHIMIYVWNKKVSWPEMYSATDNIYFDYVIKRYQAFSNVIWDVSKEALAYGRCDDNYIHERIQRLRKTDAYSRLLTVHDYGYCARFPEKVDFISIQTWVSGLYHRMASVSEKHADKPVFNIEHGGYESGPYVVFPGDYTDPVMCLHRNYECIFAGTYSTYYWQCTSWNVIIPEAMQLPEQTRPKFHYYRNIRELFKRYDFSRLEAVNNKSSSGLCLSDSDDLFLYFLPGENYATHVKLGEREVTVTWFNPLTGEFQNSGEIKLRPWHGFRSPWPGGMAVLILEAESEK